MDLSGLVDVPETGPLPAPCRDGYRLRPVPAGRTRSELYCGQCVLPRCVLTGKPREAVAPPKKEARMSRVERAAWRRAHGVAADGSPLNRTCFNCTRIVREIGADTERYRCSLHWDRVCSETTVRRRPGCAEFELRRTPLQEVVE